MTLADYTIRPIPFTLKGLDATTDGCLQVFIGSPLSPRRAVWQAARMFRREFGYDVAQYGHEGREDDPNSRAFLWPDHSIPRSDRQPFSTYAVGACCFRYREWPEYTGWALQWAWFHPYYRRRGKMSRSWPRFREMFGEFEIEPPYSAGMWAFVAKHAPWQIARIPAHIVTRHLPTPVPPADSQ